VCECLCVCVCVCVCVCGKVRATSGHLINACHCRRHGSLSLAMVVKLDGRCYLTPPLLLRVPSLMVHRLRKRRILRAAARSSGDGV
jgi:hypothetical protein